MSELRTACVYVRNIFAGVLSETAVGYSFAYDREYLRTEGAGAVSLTLPLTEEVYTSDTLFPFFDGLIPEGWLCDIITRSRSIDRRDRFGLLLIACRDSIGNVTIREEKP